MLESRDKHPPEEEANGIYTVSELSEAIRQSLESEFPLVRVMGEITNFTVSNCDFIDIENGGGVIIIFGLLSNIHVTNNYFNGNKQNSFRHVANN